MILKAQLLHFPGSQHISCIHHQGPRHFPIDALPIEFAILLPFGQQKQGIRPASHVVGIFDEFNAVEQQTSAIDGKRIGGANRGAFRNQAPDDFDSRRETHVIGIRFEGQAQDSDGFLLYNPKSAADLLHELLDSPFVDGLDFLEEAEIDAVFFG